MNFREEGYISVTDLKHYAYCPRIVYFTKVLHLMERPTEFMMLGKEEHKERVVAPALALVKAEKLLRNIELKSEKMNLEGKLDYLIITKKGEHIPIDVKWTELKKNEKAKVDHKLQMAAYSLLVEEKFNVIVKRFILYYVRAKRLLMIPFSPDLRKAVKKVINEILDIIRLEEFPIINQSKFKCANCGYAQWCLSTEFLKKKIKVV